LQILEVANVAFFFLIDFFQIAQDLQILYCKNQFEWINNEMDIFIETNVTIDSYKNNAYYLLIIMIFHHIIEFYVIFAI
jgi:hypothetical protein